MAGVLNHSPAEIMRRLLIALGVGSDPDPGGNPWPVRVAVETDKPDECVTVFDTAGRDFGMSMPDRERQECHGVQVRVRSTDHPTGYAKARQVALLMDNGVYDNILTIDTTTYRVHSVSRAGDVLSLGTEVPPARGRRLFTVNGLLYVRKI